MRTTDFRSALSAEILAAALEQAGAALLMVAIDDPGGPSAAFVNAAASKLTGCAREDLLGRGPEWFARLSRDVPALARIRNAVQQSQPWSGELVLERPDGSEVAVEATVRPLLDSEGTITHWLVQARDLAERKKLEQQIWQSQKVTAIANLAGGVAHEFNNTLLAISGYTNLLLEGIPDGDPRRADALAIEVGATRAAGLINQLLAFSLPRPLDPREVSLNAVVSELAPLLERVIGENITLATELEANLGTVRADYSQLQQVLVNLVVNARDAMPLGGTLSIATANTYPESILPGSWIGRSAGAQILLTVSDTGVGMSPEIKSRLFEPFFTTKDPATASGLGLATVHAIVKQCGGYVWVQSAEGEGTSLRVYFPYSGPPAPAQTPAQTVEQPRGGTETILLVEDEPAVRHLAKRVLERYGYTVHPVGNATEALTVAAGLSRPPDLIVTDVMLPGRGGPALAECLRQLHPGVRVLFISGYVADNVHPPGVDESQGVLAKSFTPKALAASVREAIDAPA